MESSQNEFADLYVGIGCRDQWAPSFQGAEGEPGKRIAAKPV
jgi:hypothetical protein